MLMHPSIKDVAELAGVSPATVSNVRTGNKYVRPELVKRVNNAIDQLGYVANPMASILRGNKSYNVGVILPTFYHPFHSSMLKGIQDVSFDSEYLINVYPTESDQKKERDALVRFLYAPPDGIIISSYATVDNEYGQACMNTMKAITHGKKKIPIISLERHIKISGVESILSDYEKSAYETVEYLIGLGHKKIAHISGPMNRDVSVRRFNGYKKALDNNGIEFDASIVRESMFTPSSGYLLALELADNWSNVEFSAVFAANDEIGIGAIKAFKENGIRIPQDIAVIGTDNIYAGTLINPSLSTVNVPAYKIGRMAMSKMLDFLSGAAVPNTDSPTYIDTTIIPRKSTEEDIESAWDIYDW
ncbi:MAG: LacI family transcriptional regulator [Clostridiales Family XIII bacterium]|jgi:LacI family transcriptional regulator|nr:LacI family transcriptional regulator [Clostridiales Family XIII bacterium]